MNIVNLEVRDLPAAWFEVLFKILEEGTVFTIDEGSYAGQKRLEFDYINVKINYPGTIPLLPQIPEHYGIPNPVADDYLDEYLPYLMTGELKEGESYTYGQRLTKFKLPNDLVSTYYKKVKEIVKCDVTIWRNNKIMTSEVGKDGKVVYYLNQIELLIWTYKNRGFRNNQMVLQVGAPSDILLLDPPCLRQIDTRIQDGKLNFFVYFRSWDLFSGWPANLAAIQMMKEYIAAEIGVEDGIIYACSKGLHLYDYSFDLAKMLRMREDIELKEG